MDKMISGENPFEQVRKYMIKNGYTIDGTEDKVFRAFAEMAAWEMATFRDSSELQDDVKALNALCNTIWYLSGYAYSKGFNIIGAYEELSRSKIRMTTPDLQRYVRRPCDAPKPEHMVMGLGEE